MPIPDSHVIYELSVEDIRFVAEDEEIKALSDAEIRQVESKLGDYIDWHEAILLAIQKVAAERRQKAKKS